jgi:hypothetical protein
LLTAFLCAVAVLSGCETERASFTVESFEYEPANGKTTNFEAIDIDIEAGPAAGSIMEWSKQTHMSVFFNWEDAKGVVTPPVRGRFDASEALAKLLDGTVLTFIEATNYSSYVVLPRDD